MAPKKKKGGKKKKDKGVDKVPKNAEEEKKEEIPKENTHGYVNLWLRLANAPMPEHCHFTVPMLTTSRIMMVKDQIIEYHGRIENIKLFDKCPPE